MNDHQFSDGFSIPPRPKKMDWLIDLVKKLKPEGPVELKVKFANQYEADSARCVVNSTHEGKRRVQAPKDHVFKTHVRAVEKSNGEHWLYIHLVKV